MCHCRYLDWLRRIFSQDLSLIASGMFLGGIVRIHIAMRSPFEDDPQLVGQQLAQLVGRGTP